MTEPSEARGERLESWKRIAAYLRRDVRTVQRWEQTNGLPVHRHQRAQRAIPYAYTKELDVWWTGHSDIAPSEAPPNRKGRFIAAAVALLFVLIAGTYGVGQLLRTRFAAVPPNSIAVLPFVDLSEGMVLTMLPLPAGPTKAIPALAQQVQDLIAREELKKGRSTALLGEVRHLQDGREVWVLQSLSGGIAYVVSFSDPSNAKSHIRISGPTTYSK